MNRTACRFVRKDILAVLLAAWICSPACAPAIEQGTRWEQSFVSSTSYANPFMDVLVSVTFTGPQGQSFGTFGFWDGGDTFKIRCAFPATGTWNWQTSCSDASNSGLHNRQGSVSVSAYAGSNALLARGFLRVHADRRHLEHADGTPFVWMGETLWGATVWLTENGWKSAIDTLRDKRFSVLQTNFARKAELDTNGESPWSSDRWNVSFMRKLDRMFDYANDQGIHLFVNGLIDLKWDRGLAAASFERMLKMIAARYYAHHIGYSSSMDDPYSTQHDEANAFLDAATARHLLTQHPGSTDPYPPKGNMWTALQYYDKPYEDYVMVEAGASRMQWYYNPAEPSLVSLYAHEPHKPLVNGEAGYEGLSGVTAADCARTALATFLSGGCGFTHGSYLWNARDADLAAWAGLPGKAYMTHIRDFFASLDAGRCLIPRHDLVLNQPAAWADKMPLAVLADFSKLAVYLPKGGTVQLNLSNLPAAASVSWLDPLAGSYTAAGTVTPGTPRSFTSPLGVKQVVLLLRVGNMAPELDSAPWALPNPTQLK